MSKNSYARMAGFVAVTKPFIRRHSVPLRALRVHIYRDDLVELRRVVALAGWMGADHTHRLIVAVSIEAVLGLILTRIPRSEVTAAACMDEAAYGVGRVLWVLHCTISQKIRRNCFVLPAAGDLLAARREVVAVEGPLLNRPVRRFSRVQSERGVRPAKRDRHCRVMVVDSREQTRADPALTVLIERVAEPMLREPEFAEEFKPALLIDERDAGRQRTADDEDEHLASSICHQEITRALGI